MSLDLIREEIKCSLLNEMSNDKCNLIDNNNLDFGFSSFKSDKMLSSGVKLYNLTRDERIFFLTEIGRTINVLAETIHRREEEEIKKDKYKTYLELKSYFEKPENIPYGIGMPE